MRSFVIYYALRRGVRARASKGNKSKNFYTRLKLGRDFAIRIEFDSPLSAFFKRVKVLAKTTTRRDKRRICEEKKRCWRKRGRKEEEKHRSVKLVEIKLPRFLPLRGRRGRGKFLLSVRAEFPCSGIIPFLPAETADKGRQGEVEREENRFRGEQK